MHHHTGLPEEIHQIPVRLAGGRMVGHSDDAFHANLASGDQHAGACCCHPPSLGVEARHD